MRSIYLGIITAVGLVFAINSAPAFAEPGGCLKYGAGGAVAGHFVGKGHSVLGGAAGCAAGAYRRHKYHQQTSREHQYYNQHH